MGNKSSKKVSNKQKGKEELAAKTRSNKYKIGTVSKEKYNFKETDEEIKCDKDMIEK